MQPVRPWGLCPGGALLPLAQAGRSSATHSAIPPGDAGPETGSGSGIRADPLPAVTARQPAPRPAPP